MSSHKGSKSGKYVGNGGSAPIKISHGFVPEMVKIYSAQGIAVKQEKMAAAKLYTDAAGPADLAASAVVFSEADLGMVVTGNIAGVNSNGVEYFYEMF